MNIAIYDNRAESVDVLLDALKYVNRQVYVFSDSCSLFTFLNDNTKLENWILMIADQMFDNVNQEIEYFIKKFDIVIPVLTYVAQPYFLTGMLSYLCEYSEYYTTEYIKNLKKIKDAFLQFTSTKKNSISIASTFSTNPICYYTQDQRRMDTSILTNELPATSMEQAELSSGLNKQQKQLLSYLASNYKGVQLEEIMLYIWNCHDESKKQNAYVLIHSLRKVLECKTHGECTIKLNCKKYKLLQVSA